MNAFSASYSDFKLVKTRGCVQIIFEVPVEQSTAVLKILGGMPTPAEEKWFGIAPLDPKFVTGEAPEPSTRAADLVASASASRRGEPVSRPKQAWNDMAPSQQAGVLCSDDMFWKFLREHRQVDVHNSRSAAEYVRDHCRVRSRADIVEGDKSYGYWRNLVDHFRTWQREPEYVA